MTATGKGIERPLARAAVIKRFAQDRSGAALVEFSLIAGMLLLSLLYVFELGLTHLTTLQLESATSNVARVIRTGRIDGLKGLSVDRPAGSKESDEKLTENDVRAYICARLVFAIDCIGNSRVHIRDAGSLGDVAGLNRIVDPFARTTNPPLTGPVGNRFVLVTVFLRSPLSMLGKSYDLRAATVLRNEPFNE